MKEMDWQMLIFVSASLIHDYWIFWGLPRIYYWNTRKYFSQPLNVDDNPNDKIV